MSTIAEGRIDGRKHRRELNRRAVLDAAVELFSATAAVPQVDEVAAAAHVSTRSVYRYFADRDDLIGSAIRHGFSRSVTEVPLADEHAIADGPDAAGHRIARFVDHRLRVHTDLAALFMAARSVADTIPAARAMLDASRFALRQQITDHFAPDLAALPAGARSRTIIGVELPFHFEALAHLIDTVEADSLRRSVLRRHVSLHLSATEGVGATT
ncbi:MAG: helix-turn-helix domain-containing protein [Actinomycetota bacterium]